VLCADDPGAVRLAGVARADGIDVRTYGTADDAATTPMADIGCFQGYVYTRITASGDVLYCCNTEVRVGSLADAPFAELWHGAAWQALRDRFRRGDYMAGCERCGKFEQNVKLSQQVRAELGDATWRALTGQDRKARLAVVS